MRIKKIIILSLVLLLPSRSRGDLLATKPSDLIVLEKREIKGRSYKVESRFVCKKLCQSSNDKHIERISGPIPPSNSNFYQTLSLNNKIVRQVVYDIGDFGLRKTPSNTDEASKKFHWILAGDSNIFGEWCKDQETISANLARNLPDYSVSNWGRRGGGPHNTLSFIKYFNNKKIKMQDRGLFTYTFFPSFMYERVIGSKNYTEWDKGLSPYYKIENKKLIHLGQFNKRSFINLVYNLLSATPILNEIVRDLPRITKNDVALVAEIFKEMKNSYNSIFSKGKFVVVINNTITKGEDWRTDLLIKYLNDRGILVEVLPYDREMSKATFEDGHINPDGQLLQASAYLRVLNKYLH